MTRSEASSVRAMLYWAWSWRPEGAFSARRASSCWAVAAGRMSSLCHSSSKGWEWEGLMRRLNSSITREESGTAAAGAASGWELLVLGAGSARSCFTTVRTSLLK